jgi:hypothetical protein
MKEFSDQLTEWGEADRSFFDTQFQPFQQDLIKTNQSLLPLIERNSTEALNQNVKDLLGSENLKSTFRQNVLNMGSDIGSLAANFAQQIDSIPTEEQRVGEAVSGLEQAFGQAGAELKSKMNAKGLGVTEASQRDLAISKASAKAGVTGAAAESARREKLQATTEGVGVLSTVQGAQTNQLLGAQASTQAGANLIPQVGGVQDLQSASNATDIASGIVKERGGRILGQENVARSADFTQKGVQVPKFFSPESGNVVTASGEDVKSMELTHAEKLAAALKEQKLQMQAQLTAQAANAAKVKKQATKSNPGSGGGNAPGGFGVGDNDGSGGSGGVGTGSGPGAVGGGTGSPGGPGDAPGPDGNF